MSFLRKEKSQNQSYVRCFAKKFQNYIWLINRIQGFYLQIV
ncbi:MAG: hypothetical protein ACI8VJ_000646 [Polaribacter sp.]|jgi:hypothetical protein